MIIRILSISILFLFFVFEFQNEYARATVDPIANNITITSSTGSNYVSSFNLMEDTFSNIYFHGSFTDGDGCMDVRDSGDIRATFYRSSLTNGENCTANNLNCYKGSLLHGECSITGCESGEEIVAYYECVLPIQYYADATDAGEFASDNWVGFIEVKDGANASSTVQSATEVNSLSSIAFNGFINYGTIALGATSSIQSVTIRNTGNVMSDLRISGTDMICTRGSVPIGNQHFSLVSTSTYAESTPVSTNVIVADLNLPKFNGSPSQKNVYFQVQMASSSLSGTCEGTQILGSEIDS